MAYRRVLATAGIVDGETVCDMQDTVRDYWLLIGGDSHLQGTIFTDKCVVVAVCLQA